MCHIQSIPSQRTTIPTNTAPTASSQLEPRATGSAPLDAEALAVLSAAAAPVVTVLMFVMVDPRGVLAAALIESVADDASVVGLGEGLGAVTGSENRAEAGTVENVANVGTTEDGAAEADTTEDDTADEAAADEAAADEAVTSTVLVLTEALDVVVASAVLEVLDCCSVVEVEVFLCDLEEEDEEDVVCWVLVVDVGGGGGGAAVEVGGGGGGAAVDAGGGGGAAADDEEPPPPPPLPPPFAVAPPCVRPGGQSLEPPEKLPFCSRVQDNPSKTYRKYYVPRSRCTQPHCCRCTRGRSLRRRRRGFREQRRRHDQFCPPERSQGRLQRDAQHSSPTTRPTVQLTTKSRRCGVGTRRHRKQHESRSTHDVQGVIVGDPIGQRGDLG
jgi:hypothetical protein